MEVIVDKDKEAENIGLKINPRRPKQWQIHKKTQQL